MNIFNLTPFYNYYEDMRHKSKKKLYIENDDDGTHKSKMMRIMMIIVMIMVNQP